ncbi:hypothetical protein JCM6882_002045 [Rhodosporidiobolus microsporus]
MSLLRLPSSLRTFTSSALSLARPVSAAAPKSLPQSLPSPASPYTLPGNVHQFVGKVVSVGKMKNTISVSVERRLTDHKTLKEFSKHTKYLVHDPSEQCVVGDMVKIRNCRPVSARKRFELVQVTKGARERTESHRGEFEGKGAVEGQGQA